MGRPEVSWPSSSPPTQPASTSRMMSSSAHSLSSSLEIFKFSSSSTTEPSNMCDWKRGPLPSAIRLRDASRSGLRKPSTFSGWQWSVWRATSTSCFSARMCVASASTMAPKAASLTFRPDANWPPPVETWMMPSDFESAKALSAALIVVIEVTLTAG